MFVILKTRTVDTVIFGVLMFGVGTRMVTCAAEAALSITPNSTAVRAIARRPVEQSEAHSDNVLVMVLLLQRRRRRNSVSPSVQPNTKWRFRTVTQVTPARRMECLQHKRTHRADTGSI